MAWSQNGSSGSITISFELKARYEVLNLLMSIVINFQFYIFMTFGTPRLPDPLWARILALWICISRIPRAWIPSNPPTSDLAPVNVAISLEICAKVKLWHSETCDFIGIMCKSEIRTTKTTTTMMILHYKTLLFWRILGIHEIHDFQK